MIEPCAWTVFRFIAAGDRRDRKSLFFEERDGSREMEGGGDEQDRSLPQELFGIDRIFIRIAGTLLGQNCTGADSKSKGPLSHLVRFSGAFPKNIRVPAHEQKFRRESL